ncbi:MAG: hypothetical protein QG602_136, partial [Verrucomicrobiota bacterium]|nr:hypothetical protein [Verrucomicrobiota bacterium]
LSFPSFSGALLFLGEGNAAARLGSLGWLVDCPITYWGDLDPYGFVILDRLRSHFPHVSSMLMDAATLADYEHLGVTAQRPAECVLPQLSPEERAVANVLYERRWSIEQEKIPQLAVAAYLRSMASPRGI